jgi:hypothetical protein
MVLLHLSEVCSDTVQAVTRPNMAFDGIYAPQRGGPPQAYGLYGTNIEVAQSDSEFMRPWKHQYTNYDYSQSRDGT